MYKYLTKYIWFQYYPGGASIRYLLNFIKDNYDNPPVLITENGCPSYLGLNDTDRIYKYHVSTTYPYQIILNLTFPVLKDAKLLWLAQ